MDKRKLTKLIALLIVISAVLFPVLVSASHSPAVYWADTPLAVDYRPVLQKQYASQSNLFRSEISDQWISDALDDHDHRIRQDFQVAPEFRESAKFWMKVYAKYTTQQELVFDRRHPELIYEVLDFRDLLKKSRNRVVYEILAARKLKKTIAAYHHALARLSAHPNPRHPSYEEMQILAAIQKSHNRYSFRELVLGLHHQAGQRDNIVQGLLMAEPYFPKMESIFIEFGLPPELTRLSLVESSFDLSVKSRVGAAGVWQFLPQSGREFLIVDYNRGIDERLSPLKSTIAAAKLLKRNYHLLGEWSLAVTSYNHGFHGLLGRKGKNVFSNAKRSPLGWASRSYYAEFLAVLHAVAYTDLFYGKMPPPMSRPLHFEALDQRMTLLQIAYEKSISLQALQQANPDVRGVHLLLPPSFWVAIPGDGEDQSILALAHYRPKRRLRSQGGFNKGRAG